MRSNVLTFSIGHEQLHLTLVSRITGRLISRDMVAGSPYFDGCVVKLRGQDWDTWHAGGSTSFFVPAYPDKPRHFMKSGEHWVDMEVTQHHDEMPKAPPATRKPEVPKVFRVEFCRDECVVFCNCNDAEWNRLHRFSYDSGKFAAFYLVLRRQPCTAQWVTNATVLEMLYPFNCPFCGGSDADHS